MATSKGVKVILDYIKETQGDVVFDEEQALTIWGGKVGKKIADLTTSELLQYALLSAHAQLEDAIGTIEQMVDTEQKSLNRETRRKLEKNKLILPR